MPVNKPFVFVFLALFLCPFLALSAFGRRDNNITVQEGQIDVAQNIAPQGTLVQVSGRVRLVGSSPLPDLVISGPDREWYINRDEMGKLMDLQQMNVTVEGLETVMELTFASGIPAGERRILRNISIIAVE